MNKITEEDFRLVHTHTQHLWNKLNGRTIFLTGATGFFGKCILKNLLFANNQLGLNTRIIVLSRNPDQFTKQYPEFKHASIHYIAGDVRNFEFPEGAVDYIIHAATDADTHLIVNEPLNIYDTIVEGTRQILELARLKKTSAVLYVSSGAVYGRQPSSVTHMPEEYTGSPDVYGADAAYGEGKRVAEMLCQIYYKQHNIASKIARCYSFAGTYLPLDRHFAVGNFINDLLNNKQIKVQGDGSPFRAYLYTADLVIWLLRILFEGQVCRPYNVGSDEAIDVESLATLVNSFSEAGHNVQIMQARNGNAPARYVPSVERAKNELGLRVYTPLKDAIDRTIRFYRTERAASAHVI
jgi:nucleoside-diphosphate-sugar epimerase